MTCMRRQLQAALDSVTSNRSSPSSRTDALNSLEKLFADVVLSQPHDNGASMDEFIQLQNSFQCNVASRIVAWLPLQLKTLEAMSDKHHENCNRTRIATTLVQALSLVQGAALMHFATKVFLGSKYCIEIFLDLLVAARHLSYQTAADDKNKQDPPLASSILDTLLCVLVDCPEAIREFEVANGIEVVVKLLKKAGIPRDIRMKCLEFLYFYLMDETSRLTENPKMSPSLRRTAARTPSPVKGSRPYALAAPPTPSTAVASRHPSDDTTQPFSPTPTLAITPPASPKKPPRNKSLAMLRKEVDFVPLSPKKSQISNLGIGRHSGSKENVPATPSKLRHASAERMRPGKSAHTRTRSLLVETETTDMDQKQPSLLRTTEEKKRILGQMLGNVDALVENIKQAGIWGLE